MLLLQQVLLWMIVASGLALVVGHMNNANTQLEDSGEYIGSVNMELFWIRCIY